MDGQMDGHVETSIPPYNFVAGGYNKNEQSAPNSNHRTQKPGPSLQLAQKCIKIKCANLIWCGCTTRTISMLNKALFDDHFGFQSVQKI